MGEYVKQVPPVGARQPLTQAPGWENNLLPRRPNSPQSAPTQAPDAIHRPPVAPGYPGLKNLSLPSHLRVPESTSTPLLPGLNTKLLHQAGLALTQLPALPAYRPGDTISELDDEGVGRPRIYASVLEHADLDVHQVRRGSRGTHLDPVKVNAILLDVVEGKKLLPIDVDGGNKVINGNHRLYTSQLLRLPKIFVRRP